jgi:hypothetical protein
MTVQMVKYVLKAGPEPTPSVDASVAVATEPSKSESDVTEVSSMSVRLVVYAISIILHVILIFFGEWQDANCTSSSADRRAIL